MVDDTVLLELDATIITGALILLTITSFTGKNDHEPYSTKWFGNKIIAWTPHQVGAGAMCVFGIAAILALGSSHLRGFHTASVLIDMLGFAWLIISGFIISTKERFFNKSSNSTD